MSKKSQLQVVQNNQCPVSSLKSAVYVCESIWSLNIYLEYELLSETSNSFFSQFSPSIRISVGKVSVPIFPSPIFVLWRNSYENLTVSAIFHLRSYWNSDFVQIQPLPHPPPYSLPSQIMTHCTQFDHHWGINESRKVQVWKIKNKSHVWDTNSCQSCLVSPISVLVGKGFEKFLEVLSKNSHYFLFVQE